MIIANASDNEDHFGYFRHHIVEEFNIFFDLIVANPTPQGQHVQHEGSFPLNFVSKGLFLLPSSLPLIIIQIIFFLYINVCSLICGDLFYLLEGSIFIFYRVVSD